jgi:hypothetical protein
MKAGCQPGHCGPTLRQPPQPERMHTTRYVLALLL